MSITINSGQSTTEENHYSSTKYVIKVSLGYNNILMWVTMQHKHKQCQTANLVSKGTNSQAYHV